MKTKVVFENTQLSEHFDICRCTNCNAPNKIKVRPELLSNKWECLVCRHSQVWVASEEYREMVSPTPDPSPVGRGDGFDVDLTEELDLTENKQPKILPEIVTKSLTLDSLAKLEYSEVLAMTADEAITTLEACDDLAAKLNETIGVIAANGYKPEFISGVLADIGRLRNLKKWLWVVIRG